MFIPTVRNSTIRNCCNYATARNRRFDGNRKEQGGEGEIRKGIEGRKKRHVFHVALRDTGRRLAFPSFLPQFSFDVLPCFISRDLSRREKECRGKSAKPAITVIIRPPLQPHDDRDWIQTVGCACYKPRVASRMELPDICVMLRKKNGTIMYSNVVYRKRCNDSWLLISFRL